ncbi:hypothetical protein BC628DRAFT_1357220 [Trametes gibbosa]|nr:hypothetical protein BC628DRAFT_1357220 [Trametes gibbosa]
MRPHMGNIGSVRSAQIPNYGESPRSSAPPSHANSRGSVTSSSTRYRGNMGRPISTMTRHPLPPVPTIFSELSSPAVPDSLWHAKDFMVGAGMVIIQPSTGKVVVLSEEYKDRRGGTRRHWFLPKGRKDRGESLEQAALREAYEESGFHVSFMPLFIPTHAPMPPDEREYGYAFPTVSEPIFVGMHEWRKGHWGSDDLGGEYLTFWYVGQIPDDAVVEAGTRMPDEVGYKTHLVSLNVALQLLADSHNLSCIVRTAYSHYDTTKAILQSPGWLEWVREKGLDPVVMATGYMPDQTNIHVLAGGNTPQIDEQNTASSPMDGHDARTASL